MDALQNSSCEGSEMLVTKSNECEPTNYRNESHMVKVFEVLQSLRGYVVRNF